VKYNVSSLLSLSPGFIVSVSSCNDNVVMTIGALHCYTELGYPKSVVFCASVASIWLSVYIFGFGRQLRKPQSFEGGGRAYCSYSYSGTLSECLKTLAKIDIGDTL